MRHAHTAADRGMGHAADSAEHEIPGWIDAAVKRVGEFARHQHGMFTIEDCRQVLAGQGLEQPRALRSWGTVTRQAIKRGLILKTNRGAPAVSSNGSLKPLYRRGPSA